MLFMRLCFFVDGRERENWSTSWSLKPGMCVIDEIISGADVRTRSSKDDVFGVTRVG